MTRWKDTLEKHPVFQTIKTIKALLDVSLESPDVAVEVDRMKNALDRIEGMLLQIDPVIAPLNRLEMINKALLGAVPHVERFSSDNQIESIRNGNDQFNNALVELGILGSLVVQDRIALRASAKSSLDELQLIINGAKQRVGKLDEDVASLESRLVEFGEHDAKIRKEISDSGAKMETDVRSLFQDLDKKGNDEISLAISGIKSKISKSESDIDQKIETLERLFGIVANDSITGAYEAAARRESNYGVLWRLLTVGFIVFTVMWLMYVFINFPVGSSSDQWVQYAKSATVAAVLIFGSAYSAQQATRHRNMEVRVKWFALQVNAIDLFLNSLPESDRIEIKKKLSQALFNVGVESEDTDLVSHSALKTILDSMSDIVKSLRK